MSKTDILIFDVGLGQSIFVYPYGHSDYAMMVDCGHQEPFHPIDFLVKGNYVKTQIPNLTLTNFDEDHFSGLPYLRSKVKIRSISFSKNLSTQELRSLKQLPHSRALDVVCEMKDRYVNSWREYNPPYTKAIFHLEKHHLDRHNTNNLSQVVFVEHYDSVICISGDLEDRGWHAMLQHEPNLKAWLARTNIFIASHHGRENGYHPEVFEYCKPECVVISDKGIVHETQRDMTTLYGTHIKGTGIILNDDSANRRKVLTTRNDGHLSIQLQPNGVRVYKNFKHE